MKYKFQRRIGKTGINPCVMVPAAITVKLVAEKGFIPVKGTINGHPFQQTLCPVKGKGYRLHVNGPMLKGSGLKPGQAADFIIEQDSWERNRDVPMLPAFKKELLKHKLLTAFTNQTPSRQKEINRYINNLKTPGSVAANIEKVFLRLKQI